MMVMMMVARLFVHVSGGGGGLGRLVAWLLVLRLLLVLRETLGGWRCVAWLSVHGLLLVLLVVAGLLVSGLVLMCHHLLLNVPSPV